MNLARVTFFSSIVLLLFTTEMGISIWLMANADLSCYPSTGTYQHAMHSTPDHADGIFHLIREENTGSEIDGREFPFQAADCIEIFNVLIQFQPDRAPVPVSQSRFESHPPLFTLHRVLLI